MIHITLENYLSQFLADFWDNVAKDKTIAKLNLLRRGNHPFREMKFELDLLISDAGEHGWLDNCYEI
jgi:hypothetical protein